MIRRRHFLLSACAAPFVAGLPSAADSGPLKLRELYTRDRGFSGLAQSLDGTGVTVEGFMAPPLKAESRFFVLTKMPMSVCPFCETEAEWPADILAIYTRRTVDVIPFNVKIATRGILELGTFRDPDTGFVSRVRLTNARYARA